MECAICKNEKHNRFFIAQELMFGTHQEFDYFECAKCGCVQIAQVPSSVGDYYPSDYYSMDVPEKVSRLRSILVKQIIEYRLGKFNPFGNILYRIHINKKPYSWIKKGVLNYQSKILDVGCGSGRLINAMKYLGFKNVHGIDPFIVADIHHKSGVVVEKKFISQVNGSFDFIMLNHSLEHIGNQVEVLDNVFRLLKNDRYALIRIPVCSSRNWRKYGANFFHLDAPRHFYLHSVSSFSLLAKECGFVITDYFYDSRESISMSEKYELNSPKGFKFSKRQMQEFNKETRRLNRLNDGDTACFYLYKP